MLRGVMIDGLRHQSWARVESRFLVKPTLYRQEGSLLVLSRAGRMSRERWGSRKSRPRTAAVEGLRLVNAC